VINGDDLNYFRFKLFKVKNVTNMANSHEQGGTNKVSTMRYIRKKFGLNSMSFEALDN
jgi:hypothetical protein